MPFIVAHGALGVWDEVIYLSIAAIFVAFMVISWLRSRNQEPEETSPAPPAPSKRKSDRFKLD